MNKLRLRVKIQRDDIGFYIEWRDAVFRPFNFQGEYQTVDQNDVEVLVILEYAASLLVDYPLRHKDPYHIWINHKLLEDQWVQK